MRLRPECGHSNPDDAEVCVRCSADLTPEPSVTSRFPQGAAQYSSAGSGAMAFTGDAGHGSVRPGEDLPIEKRAFAADIRANQAKSVFLLLVMVLLLGATGWAVGTWFGLPDMEATLIGIVIGFGAAITAWYGGKSLVLGVAGARRADPVLDRKVVNVVEEMAIAGGVPMPEIYIIETDESNAFATGRDPRHAAVAVTRGLVDLLSREQLQAVVAHEMAHVRHRDIRYMMLVAALVGALVMMADFARRWWWVGSGRKSSGRGGGGGYIQLILLIVSLLLIILAPLFATLLQMAVSRKREYLADAGAVELTRNPNALADALDAIDRHVIVDPSVSRAKPGKQNTANRALQHLYIVNPLKLHTNRSTALFSTHPPMDERIARLRAMG